MNEEKRSISFRINAFEVDSFEYSAPKTKIRKDTVINYDISSGMKLDPENNLIRIVMKIDGKYRKNDPIKIFTLVTESDFKVKDSEGISISENEIELPTEFLVTLLSLTYSTNRGILIEKIKTTTLNPNDFILPVIDPKSLLPQAETAESI